MRAWLFTLPLFLSLASAAVVPLKAVRTVTVQEMGQAPLALDNAGDVLGVEQTSVRLRTPGGKLRQEFGALSAKFATSAVALSPDGRTASGLNPSGGRVWDTASGKALWRTDAFLARFTADSAVLMLEGTNLTRRNARDGRVAWQHALGAPDLATPVGLDVSPDGRQVAALLRWQVTLLDARSGQRRWQVPLPVEQQADSGAQDIMPSALAFSRDGRALYVGTARHLYRLGVRDGRRLLAVSVPDPVQAVVTTSRGVAVTAGPDVKLLDARTLQPQVTLRGHTADILSLAVSRDGRTLWSADTAVTKRWNLPTLAFSTYGQIRAAALSPDGQTLALSLGDSTIRLQDAQSGAWKRTLLDFRAPPPEQNEANRGHELDSLSLLFSPDNHFLAAGTSRVWYGVPKARPDPSTLRLYSATSGRLLQPWERTPTYRLAFRADSGKLMSSAQGLHAFQFLLDIGTPALSGGFGTPEENVGQSFPMFVNSRPATLGLTKREDGLHAAIWVGQLYRVLEGVLKDTNTTLRASTDGQTVAGQGMDGLHIWDAASGKLRFALPEEVALSDYGLPLVFSSDGRLLAGKFCPGGKPGCGSGVKLRVWDTRKGEVAFTTTAWALPIAVQNDGTVWTLEGGQLKVWQP